jgi:muramoyltetrapeptide carboxypeptidase LdcA involved in peptidoglycan recycling
LNLIKPQKLRKGDTVATVSLSWGGAGDEALLWRYNLGKKRLQEVFGLNVIEMPNTLKGSDYLYKHPEERARDLMDAFKNSEIKGIFSCIGGDESIRLLPYVDFDTIKRNPKIFLGYSDSTVTHFMCLKSGLSSFYGASILAQFAENIRIFGYTEEYIKKVLFSSEPLGQIHVAPEWTSERIEWIEENKNIAKTMQKNEAYEFLQGEGKVQGRLIGGCMEVIEMIKGTTLWNKEYFNDSILFFETSEDMPEPSMVKYWLRNYGAQGILNKIKGIIWGKPYQGKYYNEYKAVIQTVLIEFALEKLPVVYNMTFGHNEPMICLPYGALVEIDCDDMRFSILESGVI